MWPIELWHLSCRALHKWGNLMAGKQWQWQSSPAARFPNSVWQGHIPSTSIAELGRGHVHSSWQPDWGWTMPLFPMGLDVNGPCTAFPTGLGWAGLSPLALCSWIRAGPRTSPYMPGLGLGHAPLLSVALMRLGQTPSPLVGPGHPLPPHGLATHFHCAADWG